MGIIMSLYSLQLVVSLKKDAERNERMIWPIMSIYVTIYIYTYKYTLMILTDVKKHEKEALVS